MTHFWHGTGPAMCVCWVRMASRIWVPFVTCKGHVGELNPHCRAHILHPGGALVFTQNGHIGEHRIRLVYGEALVAKLRDDRV